MLWIISATFIDSLLGLVGIITLWVKEKYFNGLMRLLVAFSAGALLGAAFFHLMSEAAQKMSINHVFVYTLIGFLVFFVLEEYLHWHLGEDCLVHPFSYLMVAGDLLHNAIDGLVIAGTFMVSVPLGVVTTIVIMFHEIPKELGVYAVIVAGGVKKIDALFWSFAAQTSCILGGILGFLAISRMQILALYLLPFAAGGFLYIAAADLIPSMHKTQGLRKISSFLWLCIGLAFMIWVKVFFKA